MSFSFRPAKRENVSLLIGVAGASGSGKTYSAMLLARGMSAGSGKPFCVIDTEAGRAKHYADQFRFDHGDLTAPFTPARYAEAIASADAAGYPVVVVDSASHEHAGDGGILDMQEAEITRLVKGNDDRRESMKLSSWIKPKGEHKRMVSKLLQVRAHIVLCFRAEEKIEIVKVNGKTEVRAKQTLTGLDGWVPIAEKSLPYELTCSFLLTPDAPGVPRPIKLQQQHREFFKAGERITETAGVALAKWAAGGAASSTPPAVKPEQHTGVCGTVTTREEGRHTIFDLPVNGETYSTMDAELAERAKQFAGIPVIVTFTPTSKGGRLFTAIADAEDPHV